MGFFSDLKEDLAQAVNELTEDTTEKELLEEEERLKKELAEMEEEFQMNLKFQRKKTVILWQKKQYMRCRKLTMKF